MTRARDDNWKNEKRLIETTDELRDLYKKIGYSPYVEEKAEDIINELKASIRVKIPDYTAFQVALEETEKQIERYKDGDHPIDPMAGADPHLFQSVVKKRNDQKKVLKFLNEDLFHRHLPYHIEFSLIRKRPADPARFSQLLDELVRLFHKQWIPQSQEVREAVLDKIAEVRQELQKDDGYLPTSLKSLEGEINFACTSLYQDDDAADKKHQLDEVLWSLMGWKGIDRDRLGDHALCQEELLKQAKKYLDNPWMHTPWLTNRLLSSIMDSYLLPSQKGAQKYSSDSLAWFIVINIALTIFLPRISLVGWIILAWYLWCWISARKGIRLVAKGEQILHEISSDYYDGKEIGRRIRQIEEQGMQISSLVYPLLRLQSTP